MDIRTKPISGSYLRFLLISGEVVPNVVVPGLGEDQEEDALLLLLRRSQKVSGWHPEVHTGTPYIQYI